MHVQHLTIENVKGFGTEERPVAIDFQRPDGTFAGWTVIAGRNGAGKSSVLQALAVALSGLEAARSLKESWAGWINSGRRRAHVATRVRYAPGVDRFFETGRLPKETFWTGVQWESTPSGPEPTMSAFRATGGTSTRTATRGPWAENPSGWLIAGYGPFRRISSAGSDAQRLMVGPGHVARLVSLFREDASLAESVRWLQDIYLRRLEGRLGWAELEQNVLRLLDDGLLPSGMQVDRVDSDGLWVRQGEVRLPLRDLSDGYRTVAALVLDIARHMYDTFGALQLEDAETENATCAVTHPGVVLIDEVDAHLHVAWQQRIGFWLKDHFPNVQFIVSTHSPFICQAADANGLIRLPAPGEQRGAEHVPRDLFLQIVNGSADEATLSELFGLEHTHSERAERLRQRVAELEVQLLRGRGGRRERRELAQLQLQLPSLASSQVDRAIRLFEEQVETSSA